MGGGAAAGLQGRRHRRLLDHHAGRRGDAGGARPVPHLRRRASAAGCATSIRERVRAITGINCVIELVPPRSLPRTSSGKLSRAKARNLYLSGEIQTYDIAA